MIRIVFSKDNSNCYLENTLEKEKSGSLVAIYQVNAIQETNGGGLNLRVP